MRNRDRIKQLEHELGRYQKKVGDQGKEINALKKQVAVFEIGAGQTHHAVNMVMARVCQTFGAEVLDEDNENAHIGYRVSFQKPSEDLLKQYTVRTNMSEDGESFVIGLELKWEEDHEEG